VVTYAADATVIPYLERKDPAEKLEYGLDWTKWLETGETITDADFDVPSGLTIEAQSFTTTASAVELSSGVVGETYTVSCTITTSLGYVAVRSFRLLVDER
jgi:hypothetical protein